jgi:hypothetical protein
MKLSALLAPLIAAKAPHDQIMAVVMAFEAAPRSFDPLPVGRMRSRQWMATRILILERDDYTCAYCGEEADEVDHVEPLVLGGSNDVANLVACCSYCNRSKGAKPLNEWRATR